MPKVILVGGIGDGREIDYEKGAMIPHRIAVAPLAASEDVWGSTRWDVVHYTRERLISDYPIPGWDIEIVESLIHGGRDNPNGDGILPRWLHEAWVSPEGKVAIQGAFSELNIATAALTAARYWKDDRKFHEWCEKQAREAVEAVARLTHTWPKSEETGGTETDG